MRPLIWCGDSRDRVRGFAAETRSAVGHQLNRLQHGLDPKDWKPMPLVGLGVRAIRIHEQGEHRVFYLAKFPEAVFARWWKSGGV